MFTEPASSSPGMLIIIGVGAVMMMLGIRWIFRIYADPTDAPESFLATAHRRAGPSTNLILFFALTGAILIFFGLTYLSIGGPPPDPAHPPMSLNDWALLGGAVFEAIAVVLVVRRLWGRSRV